MNYILSKNEFILEKRISQISSNIEVSFGFDLIKTIHSEERSDTSKRNYDDSYKNISNLEMSQFVEYFKKEIAEGIINGDIVDQTQFVIRSLDLGLSMALIANEQSLTYWKLIIKTVFPESEEHKLKIGFNQLVYDK
jgi:tRNA(His) 5'-end guanylyltransferase